MLLPRLADAGSGFAAIGAVDESEQAGRCKKLLAVGRE